MAVQARGEQTVNEETCEEYAEVSMRSHARSPERPQEEQEEHSARVADLLVHEEERIQRVRDGVPVIAGHADAADCASAKNGTVLREEA